MGDGQTLEYDAENRLVKVCQDTSSNAVCDGGETVIATFVYDGDGQRVQSVITTNLGSTTTYFIGNHYEVANGVVTKYYYAGAQRIAMRSNGTLYFLLGDHLGSTSLTTFANGNVVSEIRYKAWGEVRYSSAYAPTNYTYTGQYSYIYINLLDYGSRRYDPALGRFIQPDSIVPDPNNPQAYDHYAYTFNNPLRYTDPTGHNADCGIGDPYCNGPKLWVDDPSLKCKADLHYYESYRTYAQITMTLRRKPTSAELLSMTASAEYYSLIHRPDAGNLRGYGQEALARNYYSACGGEDNLCTDNQTYQFLSGYEPWWRQTGGATPGSRAKDIMGKLAANPYKTELAEDVGQILDWPVANGLGWTGGNYWNKPWQWRNVTYPPSQTGDFNSNFGAIMYIDLGGGNGYFGQYFWVVTGRQDWCYKYPSDPQWCK